MAIEILKTIAAVIAAAAAVWGIYVYFSNSRLRRAEWIASMYEKFYEQAELKDNREALDFGGSNSANISRFINEEPREFTDYLNFFEFVAVLEKSRQLTKHEIEDLFCYYLDCLERTPAVRKYIADTGYEQLDRLLRKRASKK